MTDTIVALERLARLRAEGVLSDEEFASQKAAILADTASQGSTDISNGARRYLPWLGAFVMLVAVAVAAMLLVGKPTAHDALEPTDNAAATNMVAPTNETAPTDLALATMQTTPAQAAAEPDFFFTDQMLASDRPTWDDVNEEGPNAVHFCPGATAKLTNGTTSRSASCPNINRCAPPLQ